MNIALIGSGGREHAICQKLIESSLLTRIYCIPGNAGTSLIAKNLNFNFLNFKKLYSAIKFYKIELVVVGPEVPLVNGIVDFLQKNKIGLWDVASSAERKGSLDSNIKKETPNDVDSILINYPSINVIGFNGKKSESMYNKFFKLNRSVKYVSLPSSSPANMAISFEDICLRWIELFK